MAQTPKRSFSDNTESKYSILASEKFSVPYLRMYWILALIYSFLWLHSTSSMQVIRRLRPTGHRRWWKISMMRGGSSNIPHTRGLRVVFDPWPDAIEGTGGNHLLPGQVALWLLYEIEYPSPGFDHHSLRRLSIEYADHGRSLQIKHPHSILCLFYFDTYDRQCHILPYDPQWFSLYWRAVHVF